jgi:hypothetical protein
MTKITKIEIGVKWSYFWLFCDEKGDSCDYFDRLCNLSATVTL